MPSTTSSVFKFAASVRRIRDLVASVRSLILLRAANLALQGRVKARFWFSMYCFTIAIGAPPLRSNLGSRDGHPIAWKQLLESGSCVAPSMTRLSAARQERSIASSAGNERVDGRDPPRRYLDQLCLQCRPDTFEFVTKYSVSSLAQYTSSILDDKNEMRMQRRHCAASSLVLQTFVHASACTRPVHPTWSRYAGAQGLHIQDLSGRDAHRTRRDRLASEEITVTAE